MVPPPTRTTLLEIKTILNMSGAYWDFPIFTVKPLPEVWTIAKVPYLKIDTQPIRCQINSSCGGAGGGRKVTHREKGKKKLSFFITIAGHC
jgi:hypothetical protein